MLDHACHPYRPEGDSLQTSPQSYIADSTACVLNTPEKLREMDQTESVSIKRAVQSRALEPSVVHCFFPSIVDSNAARLAALLHDEQVLIAV